MMCQRQWRCACITRRDLDGQTSFVSLVHLKCYSQQQTKKCRKVYVCSCKFYVKIKDLIKFLLNCLFVFCCYCTRIHLCVLIIFIVFLLH